MATNKPFDKKISAAAKDVCAIGTLTPVILQCELLEALEARIKLLKPENVTYNGSRLGEVAEHKTSLELQIFKLR